MKISKPPVITSRLRRPAAGFGWVDHRFVRERHITGLSCEALALYLFLITAADGEGLSYWSVTSIGRLLDLSPDTVRSTRSELVAKDLVAYCAPVWQVLSLPGGAQ